MNTSSNKHLLNLCLYLLYRQPTRIHLDNYVKYNGPFNTFASDEFMQKGMIRPARIAK